MLLTKKILKLKNNADKKLNLKVIKKYLEWFSNVNLEKLLKKKGRMSDSDRTFFTKMHDLLIKKTKSNTKSKSKSKSKSKKTNKGGKRISSKNMTRLKYLFSTVPFVYFGMLFYNDPDITYEAFCQTCILYFTTVLAGIIIISFYFGFTECIKKIGATIDENNKSIEFSNQTRNKIQTIIKNDNSNNNKITENEIDEMIDFIKTNDNLKTFLTRIDKENFAEVIKVMTAEK